MTAQRFGSRLDVSPPLGDNVPLTGKPVLRTPMAKIFPCLIEAHDWRTDNIHLYRQSLVATHLWNT